MVEACILFKIYVNCKRNLRFTPIFNYIFRIINISQFNGRKHKIHQNTRGSFLFNTTTIKMNFTLSAPLFLYLCSKCNTTSTRVLTTHAQGQSSQSSVQCRPPADKFDRTPQFQSTFPAYSDSESLPDLFSVKSVHSSSSSSDPSWFVNPTPQDVLIKFVRPE